MKSKLTIAIASGKGGTGKTTLATNLAYSLRHMESIQLIDCDVDEPNSHLFLHPVFQTQTDVGIPVPVIDQSLCTSCGRCKNFCVYSAITLIAQTVLVFPEQCHGCGGCAFICPAHAIKEEQKIIGRLEEGYAQNIQFTHAALQIGSALTPPLIRALKQRISQHKVTILDAPPGTSCPVVTTLEGTDYVILVTEPTPFGLHDLNLTVQVVRKLGIPFGVVINRSDLGNCNVEEYCRNKEIPVLLKIGFKEEYAGWYARGEIIAEHDPVLCQELKNIYRQIAGRFAP